MQSVLVRLPAAIIVALWLTACGGSSGGGTESTPAPSAAPGPSSAPPSQAGFTLTQVQVAPYAIWADSLPYQPVTVTAFASVPAGAGLQLSYFDSLVGGSGVHETRAMFDDGTHGDERAADGIWSLTFSLALNEPSEFRLYDGQIDSLPIAINAVAANGDVLGPTNAFDARVELAIVRRELDGQFPQRRITADITVTDYLVSVVVPAFDGEALTAVTERLYGAYPNDPFDFVTIFHSKATGDGIPRSLNVRNDIDGINLSRFDHSAAYGSAGRLQQVVFQNGHTLGLEVNHEIGHRWGAFLDKPALNLALPTGFHWGPSNHVGQMGNGPYLLPDGGGYLVTNAEGSEHFVANPFSALELYLMGLAEPAEVTPLRFVTDPAVVVRFGDHLAESATRVITIENIVSVYGKRMPARSAAPDTFSAAFVIVSDGPLGAAELTLSSTVARYVGGTSPGGVRGGGLFTVLDPPSFAAATGFRATLETRLP